MIFVSAEKSREILSTIQMSAEKSIETNVTVCLTLKNMLLVIIKLFGEGQKTPLSNPELFLC
jgi:hypothetical protein